MQKPNEENNYFLRSKNIVQPSLPSFSSQPSPRTALFQSNYKLFQLKSIINETTLQLEKMHLKYQKLRADYYQLENEKNKLLNSHQQLIKEIEKRDLIVEAERTAKEMTVKQLKCLKQQAQSIRETLQLPKQANTQLLILRMFTCLEQKIEFQQRIQLLQQQIEQEKDFFQQNVKKLKIQNQRKIKQIQEQIQITSNQNQQKIDSLTKKLLSTTSELESVKKSFISSQQAQKAQVNQIKNLQKISQAHQQVQRQLRTLKMKQNVWNIAKQKYLDEKQKYEQQKQQQKYQKMLYIQKISDYQKKLQQEKQKNKYLETRLYNVNDEIIALRQKCGILSQQKENLERKCLLFGQYQGKYKKAIRLQKNSEQIAHEAQQKAKKYYQDLKQCQTQILKLTQKNQFYQKIQQQMQKKCISLQLKNKQISGQLKTTIKKLNEAQETVSKLQNNNNLFLNSSFRQKTEDNQNKNSIFSEQEHLKRFNKQLSQQYQQLLKVEEQSRSRLNQQVQQVRRQLHKERRRCGQIEKELNQTKQENSIVHQALQRMKQSMKGVEYRHQRRINQLIINYKQIYQAQQQNNQLHRRQETSDSTTKEVTSARVTSQKIQKINYAQSQPQEKTKGPAVCKDKTKTQLFQIQSQQKYPQIKTKESLIIKSRSLEQILRDYRPIKLTKQAKS